MSQITYTREQVLENYDIEEVWTFDEIVGLYESGDKSSYLVPDTVSKNTDGDFEVDKEEFARWVDAYQGQAEWTGGYEDEPSAIAFLDGSDEILERDLTGANYLGGYHACGNDAILVFEF